MEEKKTINIIGSGIGGLFCGALLSKHGFKVKVFEARQHIGGYAGKWKRKDYTFEASLHEMNGFYPDDKKLRTFRYLDLFKRVKFLKIPSLYTSLFSDGSSFSVPHNYDKFLEKLIEEFPKEKNGIISVMNNIKKTQEHSLAFLREKNRFKAFFDTPTKYPYLMKNLFSSAYSVIFKKIKNPKARMIIAQIYNYFSDSLKKLNFIYFTVMYSYMNGSYWISGTSASLSYELAKIITENGGEVYTSKKIVKVLFDKKKKAIGVKCENGEEFYSNLTICNSPLKYTIENIIGKDNIPIISRLKASSVKSSMSIFSIYIGMDIDVSKLGIEDYCYTINDVEDLNELETKEDLNDFSKKTLILVSYRLDDSLCDKRKTVVNISTPSNIKYWEKFETKEEYRKEKERVANIILDRVESKFKGFREHIEIMEIGTPITMRKYSNNTDGAVYGASQKLSQSNIFRFGNEIKKRNLYFSGSWVNPGGGISGVVISAIITTELILKRYKIKAEFDNFIEPRLLKEDEIVGS